MNVLFVNDNIISIFSWLDQLQVLYRPQCKFNRMMTLYGRDVNPVVGIMKQKYKLNFFHNASIAINAPQPHLFNGYY